MINDGDNLYALIRRYIGEYVSLMDVEDLGENVYYDVISIVDRALISEVLEKTDGNKIKTARILGLNRNTLHSKIKKLDIS